MNNVVCRVIGNRACWTNPNNNVEQYSYDVPTASALRQVLGAIYSKPEMRIIIDRVEVLKPIKRETIMLNGVAYNAMPRRSHDATNHRQQLMRSYLTDVDYRVFAHIVDVGSDEHKNYRHKHINIFNTRLKRGAQYKQPFLGVREYIGDVLPDFDKIEPINVSEDYGIVLHDIIHPTKYNKQKDIVRTKAHIKMINGVIDFTNLDVMVA